MKSDNDSITDSAAAVSLRGDGQRTTGVCVCVCLVLTERERNKEKSGEQEQRINEIRAERISRDGANVPCG